MFKLYNKYKIKKLYLKHLTNEKSLLNEIDKIYKSNIDSSSKNLKITAHKNLLKDNLESFDMLISNIDMEILKDSDLYKCFKLQDSPGRVFKVQNKIDLETFNYTYIYSKSDFLQNFDCSKIPNEYIELLTFSKMTKIKESMFNSKIKYALRRKQTKRNTETAKNILKHLEINLDINHINVDILNLYLQCVYSYVYNRTNPVIIYSSFIGKYENVILEGIAKKFCINIILNSF